MDNTIRGISVYAGVPGARHTKDLDRIPRDEAVLGKTETSEEEPKKKRHLLRKLMLGGALTVTALGAAGVGATYVAATAPICADANTTIGLTNDGLCVNQEIGLAGAHGWRILSGLPHLPGAIQGLDSHSNQVFHPDGSVQAPPLMQNGELTAVTFNVHHGRSPDDLGARPQVGEIARALHAQKADVYLMQEVAPTDVDDYVNGTGMVGYYSQTTMMQGNLILVHPDLKVNADFSQMLLNGGGSFGDAVRSLENWATNGGGAEPRGIQTVEVELPNGKEAVLWNTHQPTTDYTDQQRIDARAGTMRVLDEQTEPGQIVIGGGDINAGEDGSLASDLRAAGHEVHFYHIDSINTRGATGPVEFEGFHLNDSHGFHLSDHPMGKASVPV